MSGPTVTFKVRFGNEAPRQQEPGGAPEGDRDAGDVGATDGTGGPEAVIPEGYASRIARHLAMAHKMDAMLRDGRLRDYDHAAAWLGVSKARANVISHLVFLAPEIQEAILLGDTVASERRLREIAREPVWEEQRGRLKGRRAI